MTPSADRRRTAHPDGNRDKRNRRRRERYATLRKYLTRDEVRNGFRGFREGIKKAKARDAIAAIRGKDER